MVAVFTDSGSILLRKDLRTLRYPVLLIFDAYEGAANNRELVAWLSEQLLAEVETASNLLVIIAGQRVPTFETAVWRRMAKHLRLNPITNLESWERWVARRYPTFPERERHLPTLLKLSAGSPLLMATFCATLSKD